jgi:hypothetical protein
MSEAIRVRLLLARFWDDTEPVVIGSVDAAIWEHWEDSDEAAWKKKCQESWGADPSDYECREVWAEFSPQDLVDAFATPVVQGTTA